MDFGSLTRRELQGLCKKNKIPANLTNIAMADALKSLEIVEGIEEFLNPSESETAKSESVESSVELPQKPEVTSPYIPPTCGRKQRTAVKEDPQTLPPMTRTRGTSRKTRAKYAGEVNADASETPAVVTNPSGRRVTVVSSRRKMEARLNECAEENEMKDIEITSAAKEQPQTLLPMTRSRKTRAKDAEETKADASKTPAVPINRSGRRVSVASSCRKMEAQLNECAEEDETKGAKMTPTSLALTSRRKGIKKESEVKRTYSTRRAVKLSERSVEIPVELKKQNLEILGGDLFMKECGEKVDLNVKNDTEGVDEVSEIAVIEAKTAEVLEETSEKTDFSEVSSDEKQDASNDDENKDESAVNEVFDDENKDESAVNEVFEETTEFEAKTTTAIMEESSEKMVDSEVFPVGKQDASTDHVEDKFEDILDGESEITGLDAKTTATEEAGEKMDGSEVSSDDKQDESSTRDENKWEIAVNQELEITGVHAKTTMEEETVEEPNDSSDRNQDVLSCTENKFENDLEVEVSQYPETEIRKLWLGQDVVAGNGAFSIVPEGKGIEYEAEDPNDESMVLPLNVSSETDLPKLEQDAIAGNEHFSPVPGGKGVDETKEDLSDESMVMPLNIGFEADLPKLEQDAIAGTEHFSDHDEDEKQEKTNLAEIEIAENQESAADTVPSSDSPTKQHSALNLNDETSIGIQIPPSFSGAADSRIAFQPISSTPAKKTASKSSVAVKKIADCSDNNKENIGSGGKLVVTKERPKMIKDAAENPNTDLSTLSMRKLNKMLKELHISKPTQTDNGSKASMTRLALQALPENRIADNSQN